MLCPTGFLVYFRTLRQFQQCRLISEFNALVTDVLASSASQRFLPS